MQAAGNLSIFDGWSFLGYYPYAVDDCINCHATKTHQLAYPEHESACRRVPTRKYCNANAPKKTVCERVRVVESYAKGFASGRQARAVVTSEQQRYTKECLWLFCGFMLTTHLFHYINYYLKEKNMRGSFNKLF